ncbi:MAG: glutamate synthase large subunit [Candidatus Margulisiibacteriota bacterium]
MGYGRIPAREGLYDPQFEHDACGVGFVCHISGKASHSIVEQGLQVLKRLAHRGAVGADPETGDGAGILIQIPHEFFSRVCEFELPQAGQYGTGLVFLPQDKEEREYCKERIEKAVRDEGQKVLGWRGVPVNSNSIGMTARETQPSIEQVFIGCPDEKKLYSIRRKAEIMISRSKIEQRSFFYITNLSTRTVAYKGLLMPNQVQEFFLDLKDPQMQSAIAVVHSRYSTNTFPTWDLSQPFRFLAHNGEINTLRGNINWMKARGFTDLIREGQSDSATLDNVLELLVLSGRSLPHAMMMLVPQAWEHNEFMSKGLKDFYKYHACFMEPWDGPAALAFTDGTCVGAMLDRNGLRPTRYIITKDDFVVMASEAGVLDIPDDNIRESGRITPGKMFYVDTKEGRIIEDAELKDQAASRQPYSEWVKDNLVEFEAKGIEASRHQGIKVLELLKAFGYTREDLNAIIKPMAEEGKEPIGSMGNDTPHAVLSNKPQLLYNYFKQMFAQVTNPPIDPIREELVMSLDSFVGPKPDLLKETPGHCKSLHVKSPILTEKELQCFKAGNLNGFKAKTISLLFKAGGIEDFKRGLDRICKEAEEAVKEGYSFIILSDRGVDANNPVLPALLAVGAVHHHLIKNALRTSVGLLLDSGEPREVHHFAVLFGYGADLISPYGAFEAIDIAVGSQDLANLQENYRHAIEKGILKILSKMGISTLRSYRGAQIFEALGLADDVIEKCFTGTVSRIGGLSIDDIARQTLDRHKSLLAVHGESYSSLASGGVYQWRRDGEFHLWNPESIAALQDAVRKNDYGHYKEFALMINDQSKNPTTLRSLLRVKEGGVTSPRLQIDQVEPIGSILKRFATGAMSFGSISKGAHETIALAMNRIGGKSNTGEGGEDPARFTPLPNGDSKRSAIKQVASGRFGVTTNYLTNADELQIKMAQGAKPGEGGQLPGHKVSAIIARTRYTTPGVTLISPPPHHDIYSIEDLAQLIFDLKNVNPDARISVKLVSEAGVGTVAAGVAKAHADMILISGGDGGTGASPKSSIRHAGLPWELGLSETHQTLVLNNLRDRVRIQTDGQLRTGRDVAMAALLGANEFGFATSILITLGCVMLRHCHLNNCSLGVATQDELLSERFAGKPEYIVNYLSFVAQELREIMADLGIRTLDEMVGRTDLLEAVEYRGVDLGKVLYRPDVLSPKSDVLSRKSSDALVENILDKKLIELTEQSLKTGKPIEKNIGIKNSDRAVGAMLSGEICKVYGEEGLPDDTIKINFKGIAGQSFGAFLAKGATFELEGLANDYVGKGISGGKIIVAPSFGTGSDIVIGNTAFYGAIAGEAYIRGTAGERFCIRNSGLHAVVEGVGDHGCEYMTGGRVVVIGKTGLNFGAGMSGGIAYVYDEDQKFTKRCNLEMVELEGLANKDKQDIEGMLFRHHKYTGSTKAKFIMDNFAEEIKKFVKVMPFEYKRILQERVEEVSDG